MDLSHHIENNIIYAALESRGPKQQGSKHMFTGGFVDPHASGKGWHSRGYLPHFDHPGLIQFITFRLADSLPIDTIATWQDELKHKPRQTQNAKLRERIETWLDKSYGDCVLREPELAAIVEDSLLHGDGHSYRLLAWVIMPNHVHVLIETMEDAPVSTIVESWKKYSARRCNEFLQRKGRLWMPEYFDRYIRNEKHFTNTIQYIHENPVTARLTPKAEDWRFSSAWRLRKQ